jgi:hypothetical protein
MKSDMPKTPAPRKVAAYGPFRCSENLADNIRHVADSLGFPEAAVIRVAIIQGLPAAARFLALSVDKPTPALSIQQDPQPEPSPPCPTPPPPKSKR